MTLCLYNNTQNANIVDLEVILFILGTKTPFRLIFLLSLKSGIPETLIKTQNSHSKDISIEGSY